MSERKSPAKKAAVDAKPRGSSRVQGRKGRAIDEAARKAAGQARARGAEGPRKGANAMARQALRDRAIVLSHHAGVSTAQLAKDWGIAQRSVQDAIKRSRSRSSALEAPPMQIVEGALAHYEELMQTWSTMATAMFEADAWAPAVGALKGYSEAFERYMQTLAELGKLPENLELFRMESELARLGQLMLDALDDLAAGKLSAVEMRDRVKELVGRRELPAIEGHTSPR